MGDGEIFIAVISLIFWVILFVRFFQMAADVSKIKKRIGQPDSDFYRYIALAKEEHYLGNADKEREYLMRAQCHVQTNEQDAVVQKLLDALDNKHSDDNSDGDGSPVTPPSAAFAENLIGR